jgi:hypothetical protein
MRYTFLCVLLVNAVLATSVAVLSYAQIGKAPVGGTPIGKAASEPTWSGTTGLTFGPEFSISHHPPIGGVAPQTAGASERSGISGHYTSLPAAVIGGQVSADEMTPEERLRSAVEFCRMDFTAPDGSHVSEAIKYTDPSCDKIEKAWESSAEKRKYEAELAQWRSDQLAREKAVIDRAAGEVK